MLEHARQHQSSARWKILPSVNDENWVWGFIYKHMYKGTIFVFKSLYIYSYIVCIYNLILPIYIYIYNARIQQQTSTEVETVIDIQFALNVRSREI